VAAAARDGLEAERAGWLAQIEGEGQQLAALFKEARDAKERLLGA
jgi:hypothetical protein